MGDYSIITYYILLNMNWLQAQMFQFFYSKTGFKLSFERSLIYIKKFTQIWSKEFNQWSFKVKNSFHSTQNTNFSQKNN